MSSIVPHQWALSPGTFSNTQPPTDSGVGPASSKRRGGDVPPKLSASGFACPYYKSNPQKYIDCLSYTSASLSKNIKQHMERCHKGPEHYCPACALIFSTEAEANEHIVGRQCVPRLFSYPGMNKDQWNRVCEITKARGGKKSTIDKDTEKWYEIWDVLFPNTERPKSARRGPVEIEMGIALVEFTETPEFHTLLGQDFPELDNGEGRERMSTFVSRVVDAYAQKAADARIEAVAEAPPEHTPFESTQMDAPLPDSTPLDFSHFVNEQEEELQHIDTEHHPNYMGD